MIRIELAVLVIVVPVALTGLGATPAAAQVSCGVKLSSSTTLTSSLTGCKPNGLILNASGITLDCAGFSIKGTGTGTGIKLGTGVSGVAIENCVVDGFATGILLGGGGGSALMRTLVQNNTGHGVRATSDSNTVQDVVSRQNGGFGFVVIGAGNSLLGVLAMDNSKAGVSLGGHGQDVENSLAISNDKEGFVGTVRDSTFSANTAISNVATGFKLGGGAVTAPNTYGTNKAFVNGANGLVVSGANPAANVDGGGNSGLANTGSVQCRIAGVACAP
jgi:hypothetical protein